LLPQYLVPSLGLYGLSWILALMTALAAGLCFIRSFEFGISLRWPGLALVLMIPPIFSSHKDQFEQFYLKSYYYVGAVSWTPEEIRQTLQAHRDLPRVTRVSSGYQEIDLVQDDLHLYGLANYQNEFNLLLDQKNQFGSHTEPIYHDTIVHAGINLAKSKPSNALVIGGGDGLLVRELLRYPEVKSITLIELDPHMIEIANQFQPLRALNKGSFHDPRVHVVIADGFEWLRHGKEKFEGIFIDLPHPNSIDLSRLYSVEFYTFAKRRLSDDGFLIFDFPFASLLRSPQLRNGDVVASIVDTIQTAGFPSVAGFGFWESFLIASPRERTFEFDYEALSPYVSDMAAFNMALIDFPKKHGRVNSIFRPVVLKTTFEGG